MLSRNSPRALRGLLCRSSSSIRSSPTAAPVPTIISRSPQYPPTLRVRKFHSTPSNCKGIRPEASEPPPPQNNVAGASVHVTEPSPLSDEEYREFSERYFTELLTQLEGLQETGSDIEAEYSAGVLNVTVPGIGVYVLNKQPPNRQIWLSSPISGPKRYDWVIRGDGMDEKEGTSEYLGGQWIYLRDGSNLTTLLNDELGLEIAYNIHAE